MPIANVLSSNTFNQFRATTNSIITEVNKLSDGTGTLLVNTLTANTLTANVLTGVTTGIDYVYKTANYTANNKQGILANTSSGAWTLTLPATPSAGHQVIVVDSGDNWGTNNLTIDRNSSTIESLSENLILDLSGVSVEFIYDGYTWNVYTQVGALGIGANASLLTLGTLPDGRFPAILPAANGVNLTYLNASNLGTGTIPNGRFPSSLSLNDVVITGNLTVTGNTTTVSANNLVVNDNIIQIGKGNVTDVIDLGLLGHYNNGANVHTGLFRDATDSTWKFFQNYSIEPVANTNIDTSNASFQYANVTGHNITSNGIFIGNGSGLTTLNASNATSGTLANARTTAASANGASTIVARDASGSFTANVITATTFSGSGSSLTNIPNSATTASSSNGASTIVARDASGSFTANVITASTFTGDSTVVRTNIAQSFTATQTFNGSSTTLGAIFQDVGEIVTVSATAATGTINFDFLTQSVLYYTTNASGNWTLNFRGSSGTTANAAMSTGQSVTIAFLVTNGSTAYYQSAFQVDGASVTPKWQGGTAPTAGNASSVDIYSITVIKTGSAAFTAFASQNRFA